MTLRNLTTIENEIVQLRVELRQLIRRQVRLQSYKILAEESSLKFVDKIVEMRNATGISQSLINEEIQDYQNQVEELEQDASDYQALIKQLDWRRAILSARIRQKQREYQQLEEERR